MFCAAAFDFSGGRSDCQYFSDRHVDSGADAYLCSEDYLCVFRDDAVGFLDFNGTDGVYDQALVEFQYLSGLKAWHGRIYVFTDRF